MGYIPRNLESKLKSAATQYPVVTLSGPGQSGKSTLARHVFPDRTFFSFDDPDSADSASRDPRGFLDAFPEAVLAEAHKVPEIFSHMRAAVDRAGRPGQYILTGDCGRFLEGRSAVLRLLPFSMDELSGIHRFDRYEPYLFNGGYPQVYEPGMTPERFYAEYIQTYMEREVRTCRNIVDLERFHDFMRVCARNIGKVLNLSYLAKCSSISRTTAKSWLSLLENGNIIFLLQPYYRAFNRRVIKTPKLYFYDTGVAAHLLNIHSQFQMESHYIKCELFETLIIGELVKRRFNQGEEHNCFFWQDKDRNEVECIVDLGDKLAAIGIKPGYFDGADYFSGLKYLKKISGDYPIDPILVYGGNVDLNIWEGRLVSWRNLDKLDM